MRLIGTSTEDQIIINIHQTSSKSKIFYHYESMELGGGSIDLRMMINLPQNQVDTLDALVERGLSSTRTALIQQIISAFLSDIKNRRPETHPSIMESALGALAGAFLFALGAAVLKELFGGD
jgi:hypothetical protein